MMNVSLDVHHFAYRPAAVLRVTGEDALTFLQGQFTQELRGPAERLAAYGLWLNQKGKVLGDSFAIRDGAAWVLVSITTPADIIRERLESYIIADDVAIEDQTTRWTAAAVVGTGAEEALRQLGLGLPPIGQWAAEGGGMLFRGRREVAESWEWLVPLSEGAALSKRLPGSALTLSAMELRRIRAGIPAIPAEFGPGDLPNEAGLETDAVSFTKGCYLGQEVMARLKSMGQVRRRLVVVEGAAAPASLPCPLYAGGRKIGDLRATVPSEQPGSIVGLALVSLLGLDATVPLSLQPEAAGSLRIVSKIP